jgi:hypothetical protein
MTDTQDVRKAIEEVSEDRERRHVPVSLKILHRRPAAYAAFVIAIAQALPHGWAQVIVYGAAAFIVFWNARVRRGR